jgi:hypothetical protein
MLILDENLVKTIPNEDDYYYFRDDLGSVRDIYDSDDTSEKHDYAFGPFYGRPTRSEHYVAGLKREYFRAKS